MTADFLQLYIVWSSALYKVGVVGHTSNSNTQEVDVRGSGVFDVLGNSDPAWDTRYTILQKFLKTSSIDSLKCRERFTVEA